MKTNNKLYDFFQKLISDPFEDALADAPNDDAQPGIAKRTKKPLLPDGGVWLFTKVYRFMALLLCFVLIGVMLYTTSNLPPAASPDNPYNNEVSARYIEKGLEETGAVNIVAGMILDYRAFDTFGESCVLFTAICCVMILLKSDAGDGLGTMEKDLYNPLAVRNDNILSAVAAIVVPVIILLGIYVVLNGHLSAGGGFSGGAIIGAGLILYFLAFGYKKAEDLFSFKTFKILTCSALTFYCLAKSYAFYTAANHIESIISLGTPGAILSSGLILPLNICVGLVVACTMYSFYVLFRKGGV